MIKLKLRSKLLSLFAFLSLTAPAAYANIYRIDLTSYSLTPLSNDPQGTLSGFIVIDSSLVAGDPNYTDNTEKPAFAVPNWITSASLTFTSDPGGSNNTVTRDLNSQFPITFVSWQTANGTFDPTQEFSAQMTSFGLSNGAEFLGATLGTKNQNFYNAEAELIPPANSTPAPGPLPVLGLFPIAWYYRKFKKKSINS